MDPYRLKVSLWITLVVGLLAGTAQAETIELVPYYPASNTTGDLHATSLTVGTSVEDQTPADGTILISGNIDLPELTTTTGLIRAGGNPYIYSEWWISNNFEPK